MVFTFAYSVLVFRTLVSWKYFFFGGSVFMLCYMYYYCFSVWWHLKLKEWFHSATYIEFYQLFMRYFLLAFVFLLIFIGIVCCIEKENFKEFLWYLLIFLMVQCPVWYILSPVVVGTTLFSQVAGKCFAYTMDHTF